jgi:mono/diheme cytochrome c family protein
LSRWRTWLLLSSLLMVMPDPAAAQQQTVESPAESPAGPTAGSTPGSAAGSTATAARAAATAAPRTGEEVYREACEACHAVDGRGNPQAVVGFDVPLPDFSDCLFATVEAAEGWEAVVQAGGPVRALDRHMPAFGQALSEHEIALVVSHVRTFCADRRAWPQGDLNLPRLLVTEKAFPENEALLTTQVGTGEGRRISNALVYERRFGARWMVELNIPFDLQQSPPGQWTHGLGDVAVAVKHALYHSVDRGTIFSLGEEVALPTGKETLGLGSGHTTLETFAAFGQRLPRESFVQAPAGVGVPVHAPEAATDTFWRAGVGKTFTEGGFNRTWTPMLELIAARELASGARSQWDVVPQMQVSLSKRRHILLSGGIQVPITAREDRRPQVLTYFLWDWYEGGLLDGWR